MESSAVVAGRRKLCRIMKKPRVTGIGEDSNHVENSENSPDGGLMEVKVQTQWPKEQRDETSTQEDSDYHSAGHSDVSRNVSSSSEANSLDGELVGTNLSQCRTSVTLDEEKPEVSAKFLQLLDFSLRLGYTEAQLRSVLAKLGKSELREEKFPSQDKILGELIKLGQEVDCDRRLTATGTNEKGIETLGNTNVCPYGRKCTYGRKCRFNHPERCGTPMRSVTERLFEHHKKLSPSNSTEPDRPVIAAPLRNSPKELLCRSASNPPGLPSHSRFLGQRKKNPVMTNNLYPTALINHFQQKQLDEHKLTEELRAPLAVIHPAYLSEQYAHQDCCCPTQADDNSHVILTRHVSNPEEILARSRGQPFTDLQFSMENYWSYGRRNLADVNDFTQSSVVGLPAATEDFHSGLDGPSSSLLGQIESLRHQQVSRLTSSPDSNSQRKWEMQKNSRSDTQLNLLTGGSPLGTEEAQRWVRNGKETHWVEENLTGNYYMPSTKVWGPLENSLQPTLESLSLCDPFLSSTT